MNNEWIDMSLTEDRLFRGIQYEKDMALSRGENANKVNNDFDNQVYTLTRSPLIIDDFGHIVFLFKQKILS